MEVLVSEHAVSRRVEMVSSINPGFDFGGGGGVGCFFFFEVEGLPKPDAERDEHRSDERRN